MPIVEVEGEWALDWQVPPPTDLLVWCGYAKHVPRVDMARAQFIRLLVRIVRTSEARPVGTGSQ